MLDKHFPTIIAWCVPMIGAAVLLIAAPPIGEQNAAIGWIIFLIGVVLLIASIFALVDWIMYTVIERLKAYNDAMSTSKQIKMAEVFMRMTPEQIKLYMSAVPMMILLAGLPRPSQFLKLGDEIIPFQFIHRFIELGDDNYLCPVRTWPDGTNHYKYAISLTAHLIEMDFAEPARGMHPARWTDKPTALVWLGIVDPDD